MKCYRIDPKFNCSTHSGLSWSVSRDETVPPRSVGKWDPYVAAEFEKGGNTWFAAGRLSEETRSELVNCWAHACGSRGALKDTHVIGDFNEISPLNVIVDQVFVDEMNDIDQNLFEFVEHKQTWDIDRNCPPWESRFFLANLLQNKPTYDLSVSDFGLQKNVAERFEGRHIWQGNRSAVNPEVVSESFIWRDSYTRHVLCTEPVRDLLMSLNIHEWELVEVELVRHS